MSEEFEIKKAREYIEKELYSGIEFLASGGQAFIFLKDFDDYKIIIKYYKNDYELERKDLISDLNYHINKIDLIKLEHDNIMKILRVHEELGIMELEYCGEYTLNESILTKFSEDNLTTFWHICNAIKYLVERQLSFTDLKLENVCLFKGKNKPKLIDTDTLVDITKQPYEKGFYSPGYTDPKSVLYDITNKKFRFDEKSDIFSLGVILYNVLQRRGLFDLNLFTPWFVFKNHIDAINNLIKNGIPYKNIRNIKNEHFKELITESINVNGNRPSIDDFIDKFEQIIPKKIRKIINNLNIK